MKYLLPNVPFYKASLHTHSTVSDGKLTPEEVRDAYKAKGYSILALTDHSVMVEHQHLNQEDFLMLTGAEIDIDDKDEPNGITYGRNRHFCLIAKDPKHLWVPFRDPNPIPCSVQYEYLDEFGPFDRSYTPENTNAFIAECNRQGYLVTYNHPVWSLENYNDYAPIQGLWGVEYRNGDCVGLGYDENNSQIYQDLLNLGNRIFPVCADDTHRAVERSGYPVLGDSFTMIGADKLDYATVIEAMERGDLYASCGPLIHSLTWDGTKLHITCSPAAKIQVVTHICHAQLAYGQDAPLTEAVFDMTNWLRRAGTRSPAFLRLIVTDESGRYAVTRAYWLDELTD